MKTLLTILTVALTALSTIAQGVFTVQLSGANEVPPNSSLNIGNGQFTLNGSLLSWSIGCPDLSFTPIAGNVYGPATTSQTAPFIFSLGTPTVGPGPQGGTLTLYSGSITLTGLEISDLQSELWYVNILSDQYPEGEIRGQILAVPEPGALGLFGLAGAVLLCRVFKRCKHLSTIFVATFCLMPAFSEARAQGVIDSATTTGPVIVAPGGSPSGQSVAPWVDVDPTMPYMDSLPVFQEQPSPPLPGPSTVPEPSTFTLLLISGAMCCILRKR